MRGQCGFDLVGDYISAISQGRIDLKSDSSAGSSCAASIAPACRACGHIPASAAPLTVIAAKAKPIRRRFIKNTCVSTCVPVLTFVPYRGGHFYECQNPRDTSNHMILVWL